MYGRATVLQVGQSVSIPEKIWDDRETLIDLWLRSGEHCIRQRLNKIFHGRHIDESTNKGQGVCSANM